MAALQICDLDLLDRTRIDVKIIDWALLVGIYLRHVQEGAIFLQFSKTALERLANGKMLSPIVLSTISDTDDGASRGPRTRSEKQGHFDRVHPEKAKSLESRIKAIRSPDFRANLQV